MKTLVIILKAVSILAMAWRGAVLLKLKMEDPAAKLKFDLISTLEVATGFGLALVGWLAVLDETTYVFTAGLNALAIVLTVTHNFRIIVAGDRKIMIAMKIYSLREIKGIKAGRFTLYVLTKTNDRINVLVPLTMNTVLQKMKYLK